MSIVVRSPASPFGVLVRQVSSEPQTMGDLPLS